MTSTGRPDRQLAPDGRSAGPAGNETGQRLGERPATRPTPNDAATAARAVPRLRFPPCEACGEPITGHGHAVVRIGAALNRGRQHRQARRRGDESPPLVPWRFLHAACNPDRTAPDAYFIGTSSARTARRLLIEILKVTARDWAEDTDWRRMIATILAASRRPPDG